MGSHKTTRSTDPSPSDDNRLEWTREARIQAISNAWLAGQTEIFHSLPPSRWEQLADIAAKAQQNASRYKMEP